MNNVKQTILEKIKNGEVKKKSPYYFLAQNYFFWVLFVLSVAVGAIAFSSFLIHFVVEPGPWHRLVLEEHDFYYFFKSLPVLWLVLIIVFISSAWFNYKNTKKAYKKHNFSIVLVSVTASLILGLIIFFSGMGRNIDSGIQKHFSGYGRYSQARMEARKEYLNSIGVDVNEFIKHRRLKCKRKGHKCLMK